jgi:hypothetical protein
VKRRTATLLQLFSSCIVSGLRSVNFPAMPDGEQMNPILLHVEGVNDPVVANASENGSILSTDDVETI